MDGIIRKEPVLGVCAACYQHAFARDMTVEEA
jgi:hypothetical protein